MYFTGLDPPTMEPIYVPKAQREKAMQRALLQWRDPRNHALVREALRLCGREDLIGFGRQCLVPPRDLRGKPYGAPKAAAEPRGGAPRAGRPERAPRRGNAPALPPRNGQAR